MRLEEKIIKTLARRGLTLSTAESCSGGLLAGRLTDVPGSSEVFRLGLVVYSNEAKQRLLKIPAQTLKRHGAVSEAVAVHLARGVRRILKTDLGLGVTGIAGPSGGSKRKPVGLTYIAVDNGRETVCLRCLFPGSRRRVRAQAVRQALNLLLVFLS